MLIWLRELLYDKACFEQYARTALAAFSVGYETGMLPEAVYGTTMWYFSKAALVLALFLRAGEKNHSSQGQQS